MINPVHAYYQIIFLTNLYFDTEDSTYQIYKDLADDLVLYFHGMEFDKFVIKSIHEDGDCLLYFYDDCTPCVWVPLKDISEYK